MTTAVPTAAATQGRSILLDTRVWGCGRTHHVGTVGELGLHLADRRDRTDPAHRVRLAATPPWLAAPAWSEADVAVLLGRDGMVRRLDPRTSTFEVVVEPDDLGVARTDLAAVATSRADIYLLDVRRSRVLVVSGQGVLRAVLRAPDRPVAVCGLPDGAAVLVARTGSEGVLLSHRTGAFTFGSDELSLPAGRWSRCLADRDGRAWVVDEVAGTALQPDPGGARLATNDGPDFRRQTVRAGVEVRGTGVLLQGLPGPVNRDGRPVPRSTELARPQLERLGWWTSDRLDSGLYRCRWHRIRVDVALPPRTAVHLSTHTADVQRTADEIAYLRDEQWQLAGAVTDVESDVLVRSGPGRFLWLRVELHGDGYGSPAVESLRVEFPRRSYLRFLPAVYAADPTSADFLARYLAIPGTVFEHWDRLLAELPRYLDPPATPGPFVNYLASWLDVPVEGTWTPDQQRQLVGAARGYLRRRGTRAAVRDHVAAYLGATTGSEPAADELPQIVEGFQQRHYLMLPAHEREGRPLWSRGRVGRLQPDRFDRLGEVRLVADGDPRLDVFAEHAHRFAVLVPAASAATVGARAMLRRAIAQESPAHVHSELVPVEPALCLGLQSQLGIDTAVAAATPVRLLCRAAVDRWRAEGEPPPVPPLGALSVLSGSPPEARVGEAPSGQALLAVG